MATPKKTARDLPAEDRARLFRDIQKKAGDTWSARIFRWVRDAVLYGGRIVDSGESSTREERALFVIRAFSTLEEIPPLFESQVKTYEMLKPTSPAAVEAVNDTIELVRRLRAVATELSEDEKAYLLFRRDHECHPIADAYRLKFRGNKLQDTRRVFGREWKIEDLDHALVLLKQRHNSSEVEIVIHLAKKLFDPLRGVLELVTKLCTVPTEP